MTTLLPQRNPHERWREIRRSAVVANTIAMIISSLGLLRRDAAMALGAPEAILDLPWQELVDRVALAVSRLDSSPMELSDMLMLTAQAETADPGTTDVSTYGPYVAIAQPVAMLVRHIIGTNAAAFERVYRAVAEMAVPPIAFSRDLKVALSKLAHDLEMQRLLVRAFACGMPRAYYPASLYQYEVLLAEARSIQGTMAVGASGGKPGSIPPEKQAALIDDICKNVKGKVARPAERELLLLCIDLSERHKIAFHRIVNGTRRILDTSDADSSPRARRVDGVMDLLARFYGWYTAADYQSAAS